MPSISLVVCIYQQRELLQRLIDNSAGCYDDFVVVHDGPDTTGVREAVERAGGRFYERPREYQQEPHWPFSWGQAAHDWILRLDADEFPSDEMRDWLQKFRTAPQPATSVSGFTCYWPMWDGQRRVTRHWPVGRNFLFDRRRVRFFGMVEQTPVPDGSFEALELVLCHQPERKSYSLWNFLKRKQAQNWAALIAHSLLGKPTDLACWRWESEAWPGYWERIRRHPLRAALNEVTRGFLLTLRSQWQVEKRVLLTQALGGALFHCSLYIQYWRLRRSGVRGRASSAASTIVRERS